MNAFEEQCFTALRKRHKDAAWALLPQVREATGQDWRRTYRTADAIAVSLWPSRGQEIIGYEFKCTRGDWIKELDQPEKSDAIIRYCHKWYVIAPPKIVQRDEVPQNWGLLTITKGSLRKAVEATCLQPAPLTYEFLSSVLRQAQKHMPSVTALKDARDKAFRKGCDHTKHEVEAYKTTIKGLDQCIEDFERKSGIKMLRYNAGRIGEVVEQIMRVDSSVSAVENNLQRAKALADSVSRKIEVALDEIRINRRQG